MKIRFRSVVSCTALFLGAITCLAGCATTGVEQSAKTGKPMQTVEKSMARGETKTGCATSCDLEVTTRTGTGR